MGRGIDDAEFDTGIRPQDDLFGYVNGRWRTEAEIPADRAVYGSFHMLADDAEQNLRAIVEEAAASGAPEGSVLRKVGDLYAGFLDEPAVDARGLQPVADLLDRIAGVGDRAGLVEVLGALHRSGISGAFGLWVDTDARDSTRYLPYLQQGGLGLPDESYYREDTFAEVRKAYLEHLTRMHELAGLSDPAGRAERVMALETRLASAHWDRVSNRDAVKTYTLVDAAGLAELAPGFDWSAWAAALGAPDTALGQVVVRQPSYLTAWAAALDEVPLQHWQEWLAWRLVHGTAPYLSTPLVEENFAFYGRTLTGAQELRARWKRGVALVEGALGEAVGQLYVERHFPAEAKARMSQLVDNLVEAYRRSITGLDWMGPQTRQRALEKLANFTSKIGYPDRWRDYTALEIRRDDLVGNVHRATAFELDRNLAKLGSPVDRGEWFMTPQTVNAYYNPGMNEIVFPAAILQPPFFDLEADDAVNYGAIGAVIGHEIGHGFDDQGSKYDGEGNLTDWWTDDDRAEFDTRTQALIAQYEALYPRQTPDHHVNGALTVGENIGDLGGLSIAYAAYRISLGETEPPVIDGLTGAQRFFLSWARAWRSKIRDAELIRRLAIDPHSPDEFRCNTVVTNIDAFVDAFRLQPGDGLWREPGERVRIW
ncbi:MAG TPA: M13-type metalloendopeptidase [Kineosporiaceae bacterium]|nr:M13-type metalloendopeptidase [Kineosporiaceae bacterium]